MLKLLLPDLEETLKGHKISSSGKIILTLQPILCSFKSTIIFRGKLKIYLLTKITDILSRNKIMCKLLTKIQVNWIETIFL